MTRRYYPSTRERITRALDEGVKTFNGGASSDNPYAGRNSGAPLRRAFVQGWWLARGYESVSRKPVVDLSAEFADVIREVEAELAAVLECAP